MVSANVAVAMVVMVGIAFGCCELEDTWVPITKLCCGACFSPGGDEVEIQEERGGDRGRHGDRVKGPWSPEEDTVLSKIVSKFGARNSSLIARGISGRSGKSCRLRWCNYQLNPVAKNKPFTVP